MTTGTENDLLFANYKSNLTLLQKLDTLSDLMYDLEWNYDLSQFNDELSGMVDNIDDHISEAWRSIEKRNNLILKQLKLIK